MERCGWRIGARRDRRSTGQLSRVLAHQDRDAVGPWSAAAGALEHAEIGAPGANCVAILVGKHAGELMQMSEIVNGPCREKLGSRYRSQGRVFASPGEVLRLEIQSF